jgi:lipopolysaccharide transport system ATP-binding protein
MNDIAIRVENLGKLYRIGSRQNGYKTLRDSIANAVSSPFRRIPLVFGHRPSVSISSSSVVGQRSLVGTDQSSVGGQPSAVAGTGSTVVGPRSAVDSETLWALKNISFEVRRGEVVGIIGRNGAGKSTLLKILSRITEPTEGYAEIRGRVGSLLEVGTGFHAELSGRENIYLNGAILGMKRAEIERKFDEIVSFAEIEKFIDTPVKHYSSGMYVRLAFAVAAHLEPDILLVDEVLAVGDLEFQKKCIGKMQSVANKGKTVLFVSHNLGAVRQFCDCCILLTSGRVSANGATEATIGLYLSEFSARGSASLINYPRRQGNGDLKLIKAQIYNSKFDVASDLFFNENFLIVTDVLAKRNVSNASLFILIKSVDGTYLVSPFQADANSFFSLGEGESTQIVAEFGGIRLLPGNYAIDIGIFNYNFQFLDWVESAVGFSIAQDPKIKARLGNLSPEVHWKMEKDSNYPTEARFSKPVVRNGA